MLRLAIRTLRRRPGFALLNGLGLTVGLACCAVVAVFLQHELTYDTHHAESDRIYRIVNDYEVDTFSSVRFPNFFRSTAEEQARLPTRLPEVVPAVEQIAQYHIVDEPQFIRTPAGATFQSERQLVTNTGPGFADLFTFERRSGPPLTQALAPVNTAILTASTAARYFGDASPIGQTLEIGESTTVTVAAVVADPPSNSRLKFDVAMHLERIPYWAAFRYIRLAEGTDPSAVVSQISAAMDKANPSRIEARTRERPLVGEILQPLPAIHLAERALYDAGPHRNPAFLWTFAAIAGLILVITTINYANLALAQSAGRTAEVGVRKAVGGHPWQIARQFWVESTLLALACVPVALALAAAVLPAFNTLMDLEIAGVRLLQPGILVAMTALALLSGTAAGSYPALVLTRTRTVDLFSRGMPGSGRRGWTLRHGLIALQFAVLIALGSLSWVAYDQLQFMQRSDLGYETGTVVQLPIVRADSQQYQQLKQRLTARSAIRAVGTGAFPRARTNSGPFTVSGTDRAYDGGKYQAVDLDWFTVMGIEHPAVEAMRREGPGAPERVLVNKSLANAVVEDDLIGRAMINNPDDPRPDAPPIVGILPDLHMTSMRNAIRPTHYHLFTETRGAFAPLVRIEAGQMDAGLAAVRAVAGALFPETPARVEFLDDAVAALYEQERRFGVLAGVLAGVAVLLAVLGLGGLVAYLTQRRLREIGIRKALGGSVAGIVTLLNREYVQIVGVAFLVGAPLAWWAAQAWLGQFAYQIGLSPLVFLTAGAGALLVAMGAVSIQALRAAQVSPAEVLRGE